MKIGLVARQGCGKSTIAKQLEPYGFRVYSFAAKLKEVCRELFPDIMELPKGEHRWLLQQVGTELFRDLDKEVWVKYLLRNMESENIVVDDVRFPNEADALSEAGFYIVLVQRDRELLQAWGYDVDSKHLSETAMVNIAVDLIVINDGEYPFKEAALTMLAKLLMKEAIL